MTCVLPIEPSKPNELTITEDKVTETAVTLSWKQPGSPHSPFLTYVVQFRKFGEDHIDTRNTSTCQCKITGLTPATEYEFRVAATNSAGRGRFTDFVTQRTKRKFIIEFVLVSPI